MSVFFPFIKIENITLRGLSMGAAPYFFITLGITIVLIGLTDKRWLNILSFLLGLVVAAFVVKYSSDANDSGGSSQVGIWMLFIGGFSVITGAIMGMITKKRVRYSGQSHVI